VLIVFRIVLTTSSVFPVVNFRVFFPNGISVVTHGETTNSRKCPTCCSLYLCTGSRFVLTGAPRPKEETSK